LINSRILQDLGEHMPDLRPEDLHDILLRNRRILGKKFRGQSACFAMDSSERISFPSTIYSPNSAISSFNRAGSTARPITSIRPIFSFLIWCSDGLGW